MKTEWHCKFGKAYDSQQAMEEDFPDFLEQATASHMEVVRRKCDAEQLVEASPLSITHWVLSDLSSNWPLWVVQLGKMPAEVRMARGTIWLEPKP